MTKKNYMGSAISTIKNLKYNLLITIFVESNSNRLNIESDSITSQV